MSTNITRLYPSLFHPLVDDRLPTLGAELVQIFVEVRPQRRSLGEGEAEFVDPLEDVAVLDRQLLAVDRGDGAIEEDHVDLAVLQVGQRLRSEERRVEKECRSRWSP